MDKLSAGVHTFNAGDNILSYHITPSLKPNAPLWVHQNIHWGPGRQYCVNKLAPALSKHYTVLNFSPRGCDESSRPKDSAGNDDASGMSVTGTTTDTETLRRYLGIDAFHVLSGHSLSGVSVVLYACLYPDRVKNLVPIASGLYAGHDGTAVWNHYRDIRSPQPPWTKAYETWANAKSNPAKTDDEFGQFLMDVLPSYLVDPDKDLASTVAGFRGSKMHLWNMGAYMSTRPGDEKLQKLFDLLKNAKARVLLVHGEHDMACSLEAMRIVERKLKDEAKVEVVTAISPVGHFPWIEDREGFMHAVFSFMGDL